MKEAIQLLFPAYDRWVCTLIQAYLGHSAFLQASRNPTRPLDWKVMGVSPGKEAPFTGQGSTSGLRVLVTVKNFNVPTWM